MSYTTLIRAVHLQGWADELIARQKLPSIVRRLIHATVDDPRLVQLPADEGTGRRSWDGIVECDAGNAWVPSGTSVWEMGTDLRAKAKADSEYGKRTAKPDSIIPAKSTFVFVTPRKWEGKRKWQQAKRAEGIWQSVCAWDCADLEEWLERAPAVDMWLARLLRKLPSTGISDPLAHWENLAAISAPPLVPAVFLAGREKAADDFRQALKGSAHEFAVSTTSAQELADFACAVLASSDEFTQDAEAARVLVVNTVEAWSQVVVVQTRRLFLIPGETLLVTPRMVAEAVCAGHSVLTARPYTFLRDGAAMARLPRAPRDGVNKALQTAGFESARSERLAHASAGCLTVLVRLASQFAGQAVPAWAQLNAAGDLLPLLLLGAWSDGHAPDREVVERLTSEKYETLRARLTTWIQQPDGPLRFIEGVCTFSSREESWLHLAPQLTSDLLGKFIPLAREVLGENDPQFDLPVEERPMAGVRKQVPRYSPALRSGIAETVALLGSRGENTPQGSPIGSAWRADRLVEELLGDEAGSEQRRWFALASLLPTLAEAAPQVFLDALTIDLERPQPGITALFPPAPETPDPWFSSSMYVGLLWALQRLAWSPELLPQVALIAAALVKRPFHYRSSPTPGGILHDAFAFWCPHTDASEAERCQVLDLLAAREPEVAWKLLLGLIPGGNSMIMGGDKPRWRDWGLATPEPVTNKDLWRQVNWAGERLVTLAQGRSERWRELLEEARKLPGTVWQALLAWLSSDDAEKLDDSSRFDLWQDLRKLVAEHRFYHESWWALPGKIVDELAVAEARLAPTDPATRFRWLFDGGGGDAFGDLATTQEDRKRLESAAKRQAVAAVLDAGGLEKIFTLAETVKYPGHLGTVLAEERILSTPTEILPAYLLDERINVRTLARCYTASLVSEQGVDGLDAFGLKEWLPEAVAEVLAIQPFARNTWTYLRTRCPDAEGMYWQRTFIWGGLLELDDLLEAVAMLRHHGRLLQAADLLANGIRRLLAPNGQQVLDIVEEVLRTLVDTQPSDRWSILSLHDLCELVRFVQDAPDADPSRVAVLEWHFVPLSLNGPFRPRHLHKELSSNPAFFLEVLSYLFPGSFKEAKAVNAEAGDEGRHALVSVGYHLLKSWRLIPGHQPDGGVDASALKAWINEARRICPKSSCLPIVDAEIGELLSHAPTESDGTWPCIAVREALESVHTKAILRGFAIGVQNSRGVYSKKLNEGGEQERDMSARYSVHADHCRTRWPYTSRALRAIAESYEQSARHEDERAEGRD